MPEVIESAPPSILVKLAKEMDTADKAVEKAEEGLKVLKAKAGIAEKKLVEEMITQQMKSFKSEELGGFRTQAVVYPNVQDKEVLYTWIKKKKLDWLYSMSVNGNKLKSFVKELMEQGKPIPPGVEPYTETVIRRF